MKETLPPATAPDSPDGAAGTTPAVTGPSTFPPLNIAAGVAASTSTGDVEDGLDEAVNAGDLAAKGSRAGGGLSIESLVEGAKKRGRRGPSLGARFESLPWLWQGAFWGLVCALVISALSALGALNFTRGLEGAAMDTLFRARNWRGARYPSPHVALVVVDEETVARYGFPVPRARYAELVRRLKKDGARTIAFDISFSTPGNPARDDAELMRACREAGIVIHPAVIHVPETLSALQAEVSPDARNQRTLPQARLGWRNLDRRDRYNLPDGVGGFSALPALQDGAAAIGHINVFPERDNGTLRRVPHLIRYRGRVYPSLSLAAATHALGVAPNDVLLRNGELVLGRAPSAPRVPLAQRRDEQGETLVNWVGGHRTFNTYSVESVLSNDAREAVPAGTFKDRIVLIGATNAGAFDYHPTPFAPAQPAVEMQANAIDDILSGRPLREIAPPLQTVLLWLLPIVLGALVAGRNARWTLWTTLAAVSACFTAALWLFHTNMYWPYASPLLALGCTAAACVSYRQLRDAAHLKAAEQRYALAVRAANDGIWDWDLASGYVYYAPRWKAMLGLTDSKVEPLPSEWLGRVHPDDRPSVEYELGEHLQGYTPAFGAEFRMRHADGSDRWVLARALMVRGEDGRPARLAGSLSDITSRRMAEEKLVRQALSDELTGLPNRVLFLDRLQKAIARSQRHPEYAFAVLFLDLDRFKIVNDSLGHLVGDEMLQAVARRLESCLRPGDTVARMGGDEFTLLIEDIAGVVTATTVAERIHASLGAPLQIGGHDFATRASIGIAVSIPPPQPLPVLTAPDGTQILEPGTDSSDDASRASGTDGASGRSSARYAHAEDLLRDADTAMYRAKGSGRGRYVVFDEEMHERALAQLRLETALRGAIENEHLRVYYQPIVALDGLTPSASSTSNGAHHGSEISGSAASNGALDAADGTAPDAMWNGVRLSGFEALVRWVDPERGMIPPGEFIPFAEETGLVAALDAWVLRNACVQVREWGVRFGRDDLSISVNLSGKQFEQPGLVRSVAAALENSGLPPRCLRLEITEGVVMDDAQSSAQTLGELKALGCSLAIDDFGTGYSSLAYLHQFPLDVLKIDRSFVMRLAADGHNAQIVGAIVHLAHALGLRVVAEGVEEPHQAALLRDMGCEYGQGYLFSRPIDAESAEKLLVTVGFAAHQGKRELTAAAEPRA